MDVRRKVLAVEYIIMQLAADGWDVTAYTASGGNGCARVHIGAECGECSISVDEVVPKDGCHGQED